MRNLASIQRILKIEDIPDASRIQVATVLGWHVVVKKGEFKEGHLCIYFEVDSFLPIIKAFEFLAKGGTKRMLIKGEEVRGYRLKTIRLRGQVSQGLALPIDSFASILKIQDIWEEGKDVSKLLGVVKYESPIPAVLSGIARGVFPAFIPKTDEPRIQNEPKILERYKDLSFYITEKVDGSSMTVFKKDGELHVCSRGLDLQEDDTNSFWKAAKEMKLADKLDPRFAIQGELVGSGIQKNRLKIQGQKCLIYNVFDIKEHKYLNAEEAIKFCNDWGFEMVPVLERDFKLPATVDELVTYATRKSQINPKGYAEGIVIRSLKEIQDPDLGRLSFKVVNPEYLLKHGE